MISFFFEPCLPQVRRWLQHQYPLHRAFANSLRGMPQRPGRDLRPTMSGRPGTRDGERWTWLIFVLHIDIIDIQHSSTIYVGFILTYISLSPRHTQTIPEPCFGAADWRVRFCLRFFEMKNHQTPGKTCIFGKLNVCSLKFNLSSCIRII